MHRVLLGVAAAAVALSPASGQSFAGGDFGANSSARFLGPPIMPPHRGDHPGHRRGDHRGDRGGDFAYGYAGYYYPTDFDGNRSFDPDRWNDWWHERPERAFPRWVWRNQNCTEDRMWWSGSGWRCTP